MPQRAPLAHLRPALPLAHPATPGAATASWPGRPCASRAARCTGWGRPLPTNQETYAKLEAGQGRDLPGTLVLLLLDELHLPFSLQFFSLPFTV